MLSGSVRRGFDSGHAINGVVGGFILMLLLLLLLLQQCSC